MLGMARRSGTGKVSSTRRSPPTASSRLAAGLAAIAASGAARPLIVSHEMIGRMLLRNLLGLGSGEALAIDHPHGVVYRVDLPARQLQIVQLWAS